MTALIRLLAVLVTVPSVWPTKPHPENGSVNKAGRRWRNFMRVSGFYTHSGDLPSPKRGLRHPNLAGKGAAPRTPSSRVPGVARSGHHENQVGTSSRLSQFILTHRRSPAGRHRLPDTEQEFAALMPAPNRRGNRRCPSSPPPATEEAVRRHHAQPSLPSSNPNHARDAIQNRIATCNERLQVIVAHSLLSVDFEE